MKDKREEGGAEVQGIDVIDLGDAVVETRQTSPAQFILDSCCAYTYAEA